MSRFLGFTLIELILTIAIVAILAAIAIPAYTSYLERARRIEGQAALLDAAQRMERYYSQSLSFADASLSVLGLDTMTSHGYYTLSLNQLSADTYIIEAIPTATQVNDSCGTLTINQVGQKTPIMQGCW